MKVFRKMFALAVTVAAMAIATSAFAATADYDSTNVRVKVSDVSELTETEQMTVAVVPTEFGETDAEIYYIDQDQAATIIGDLQAGLAIKAALDNPANYEVRVAGTTMDVKTFTIPAVVVPEKNYQYLGGTGGVPLGIKGEFEYNGTAKTVVLTLKDYSNDLTGDLEWDLNIPATNGVTITFGLEIRPMNDEQDLTQIKIENIVDKQ